MRVIQFQSPACLCRYGFKESPRLDLVAKPRLGHREVTLSSVTHWIERKLCELVNVSSTVLVCRLGLQRGAILGSLAGPSCMLASFPGLLHVTWFGGHVKQNINISRGC